MRSAIGGRRVADVEGPRRVAVPAVEDRAGVDRHDLARADGPLARDAVDDLVVDRDADARRERPARVDARVALERRDRAGPADVLLGEAVEVGGGDARLERLLDDGQDLGDDAAGAAHLVDLGARLPGHHRQATSNRSSTAARSAVGDVVDPLPAVDRPEDPGGPVVRHDLAQAAELEGEPRPDRLRAVVLALDERRAVEVAAAGRPRRVRRLVVDVARGLADPAAGQADHEVLGRHVDLEGSVDPGVALREGGVERLGLGAVAREAVEDHAAAGVGLGEARLEHPDGDVVGHELAALHVAARLQPDRRAVTDRSPEQVARGDVRQLESLAEDRPPGSLSRRLARRAGPGPSCAVALTAASLRCRQRALAHALRTCARSRARERLGWPRHGRRRHRMKPS